MNLDAKLHLVDEIYRIYNRFTNPLTVSCDRCCSTCCTQNVTITTLEGVFILNDAASKKKNRRLDGLEAKRNENRICPEITLNHLAGLWAQGKEIPDEKDLSPEGKCPLLEDDLCLIYHARPFACRCFLSRHNCRETGFADIDPFVLTVNTLFLQVIEHIDAGGLAGNLVDVLLFLKPDQNRKEYERGHILDQKAGLIQNRPISALLIPPEHKLRIAGILDELQLLAGLDPARICLP